MHFQYLTRRQPIQRGSFETSIFAFVICFNYVINVFINIENKVTTNNV